MPNSINSVNSITSNYQGDVCTCDKSYRSISSSETFSISEPNNINRMSYSQVKYGLSNIPTGIVQNLYSNIEKNIEIRNDNISTGINNSVSNTVEITNNNMSEKQKIEDAVNRASKRYGIDANLIKAVIKTESNFNPKVVSHAGAKGLMQIMPANFKHLGVVDPFDIYQNVDGGTKLLKEYLDKYNGNVEMALMAYNGGPTRMKNRGVTSVEHIYKMPRETQNYVKKVMKYYRGE